MIREARFVLSRRQYAVDLDSLNPLPGNGDWHYVTIEAAWFRRKGGVTYACTGKLWDHQRGKPENALAFLERHIDGRYGGECEGRWDGERYWGAQEPGTMALHLALLAPMLKHYPDVPDGYDGWWRF